MLPNGAGCGSDLVRISVFLISSTSADLPLPTLGSSSELAQSELTPENHHPSTFQESLPLEVHEGEPCWQVFLQHCRTACG